MRAKYDILWKGMLERVFDDFLRFVFPNADQRFDMKKGFTYLDKELAELNHHPEEAPDTKFVDKLVQVYTRSGKTKYLLVHVEVQGDYDKTFTSRMFKYFYRVYDHYHQPVLPVAVFSGGGGKRMGNQFHLEDDGMSLTYEFNTLDINEFTDAELKASDNPFAGVLLVAKGLTISGKARDEKLLNQKVSLAKHLYSKGFEKQKIEGIFGFIKNYVLFDKPEYNLIFNKEIDHLTGKKNTMDIIEQVAEIRAKEALEKGRHEGDEKAVKVLLSNTEFSSDKIAEFVRVPVSFVEQIKEELRRK
jgi:hypothetical protein